MSGHDDAAGTSGMSGGQIRRASWLTPELLIALVSLDGDRSYAPGWRLLAECAEQSIELEARWHHLPAEVVEEIGHEIDAAEFDAELRVVLALGGGEEVEQDGLAESLEEPTHQELDDSEPESAPEPPADDPICPAWLVTMALPPGLSGDQLTGLILDDGEHPRRLAPDQLEAVICNPVEFAEASLGRRPPATRAGALGFLLAAPLTHRIDPGPELSARLSILNDRLRERLDTTDIEPGASCAMRLEHVFAIDERAYWLSGWIHDAAPHDGRLTVLSPEGVRVRPLEGSVSFHGRGDVNRVFGPEDPRPSVGFHIYVELDRPSYFPTGWVVELRTPAGDEVEDAARHPVTTDLAQLRRRIMDPLNSEQPDSAILANQVLPALARLQIGGEVRIDKIVDYGQPAPSPEISIVIPVRQIDRIDHQLVQFARDPEFATAELIYVTPPGASTALRRRAHQWQELYGVPFRVVELSDGTRRPRAINLGAAVARGRLLVVMSGDVFPVSPGWLHRLRDAHDTTPRIGVLAPRLLHHDGSIAHAGATYVRGSESPRWERTLPLRGLSATISAARGARRVQAVSEACMMITAEAFRASEGFSELYFDGADEAGELCLRLAEEGLETWQADVSLYWLERAKSWPVKAAPAAGRFNDWLLDRRWGARLNATGAVDEATFTIREPDAETAFPQVGSGRPGAPVEILGITRATPDETWVLDAELLRPHPGTEWESYSHTYAFTVQGWALARDGSPITVELHEGQRPLRQAVTKLRREDVVNRYPDAPGADASGFQTALGTLGLPQRFTVDVDLVASDGRRTLLARIDGRRRPVRSAFTPALQPALITTLGRTGSSWLALLLSEHPQIVAYRPFQNEARVASYWMEVLRALAEPSSYIQALRPELYQGHWWIGDQRPNPLPLQLAEPHMPQWLGGENVEILAGFCQSRLDGFYSELARVQEPEPPRYFAEKCWPNEATPQLLGELYPEGREILLVRDFRDMVCSIIGFNAKRGFASFGREVTESDEEFIRYLRDSARRMLDSWNDRRDRAFLVRYEDLILEPEATLGGAFAYLEIESDRGTVRRTIDAANAMLPHVQRAHQTSASVQASVGRWKHELSPQLQAICHETFGDILEAFGYEPTLQTSSSERSATISITASGLNASSS